MRLLIVLFLFVPFLVQAQVGIVKTIFTATDTIAATATADSVEVKLGDGPWKLLTQAVNDTVMVTSDDKAAGTAKVYNLASEDWWTYANSMRVRVYNTGVDTVTSKSVGIGGLRGAITLFLRPVVSGSNTIYSKSTVEGN